MVFMQINELVIQKPSKNYVQQFIKTNHLIVSHEKFKNHILYSTN